MLGYSGKHYRMTSYIHLGREANNHHSDEYIIRNHVGMRETGGASAVKAWNVGVVGAADRRASRDSLVRDWQLWTGIYGYMESILSRVEGRRSSGRRSTMCLRFNQFHIVKTFQSPNEKHNIPCTSNIYFLSVAWPEMCQEEGFKGGRFHPPGL